MGGWQWLNENAWIASALLVIAFGGAACTMWWHIIETRSRRSSYLVVVALALLALSFVLVGVTVGERPILPGGVLVPMIRLMWLAVALMLNAFMVVYWSSRIVWRKRETLHELHDTGD